MIQIDPHAWLVTLPVTIALAQLFFQPTDHPVRKLLRNLVQWEIELWSRVSASDLESAVARNSRIWRHVHFFSTLCMGLASLASLGTFVGLPIG